MVVSNIPNSGLPIQSREIEMTIDLFSNEYNEQVRRRRLSRQQLAVEFEVRAQWYDLNWCPAKVGESCDD